MRRNRMQVGALSSVAFLAGLLIALASLGLLSHHTHRVSERDVLSLSGDGPLTDGHQVSLQQAETDSPFPIYRAHAGPASDSSISDVWESPIGNQVAIDYASGLRIYLKPVEFPDPVSQYQSLQAEGIPGTVQTLDGVSAFVVPPTAGQLGSVDLVINGIEVSIVGHGDFTTDQLVQVAQSIR